MKLPGFFLLWLLPCSIAVAQPADLYKFQEERKGNDGQIYLYEGMTDEKGTVIVPADYDYIWEFGDDTITVARRRYWSNVERMMDLQYQLITKSGFLLYEFPPELIPEPIRNGLIRTFNSETQTFGFTDLTGNRVIKYKYPEARDFSEGKAAVRDAKTRLWGYIDKKGEFVIFPTYNEAFSFSEGQAVVKRGRRFFYCLPNGTEIPLNEYYTRVFDLKEGFSVVENDSVYGFIDKTGTEILSPRFHFLDNFDQGIAVFVEHNDAGIINTQGKIVIEPRYDELYRFDQRHYLFQQNGLKGLLNTNGEVVIPAQYSAIDYFSEGLAPVLKSGKWGFADIEGKEVIPCQFAEYRGGFTGGKIEVRLYDKWSLASGNDTLRLPDYDEVLPYYGNTAAFRRDKLWGFLNSQGEEAIEPKFDEVIFNAGGITFGRIPMKDGSFRYSLINKNGQELNTGKYSEVVRYSEGLAAVKAEKKWGFTDVNGVEVIPVQYEAVRNFSFGRAAVYKNESWGFISVNGNEIIPVYDGPPVFTAESLGGNTYSDTLAAIRRSFPLFRMQVVGDYDGSCACVEDETMDNASVRPLCLNKFNKVFEGRDCNLFNKRPDEFNEISEINKSLTVLRIPGKWITLAK